VDCARENLLASGERALFRDVLVASASVPGLFPPVAIRVEEDQVLFDEVHVDATTTVPFLVPLAFVEWSPNAGDRLHSAAVYVILDERLVEAHDIGTLQFLSSTRR